MSRIRRYVQGAVIALLASFLPLPLMADPALYNLKNASPEQETVPDNPLIIFQDGRRVDPFVVVPEGWVRSSDGSLLTDEGLILHRNGTIEYPFGKLPEGYVRRSDGTIVTPEGVVIAPKESVLHREARQKKVLDPKASVLAKYPKGTVIEPNGTVKLPDGTVIQPDGTRRLADGTRILRDGTRILPDGTRILPDGKRVAAPATRPGVAKPVTTTPAKEEAVRVEEHPTLWSMLPLSDVGEKKSEAEQKQKEKAKEKPKENAKEKQKENVKEKQKEKPVAQAPGRKQEEKPEKPKKRPPRIGEELSIPKEAVKTGNLDFLEGCWQGTRPEYFSKRTIYECFCFGKNGGRGKRRVIDPEGHRRCVGGSSARLGSNGVLMVSSQGAVCSDGERWGQAEMTCRGKGQHTPCSWVFRDANSGQQAYEIPFVRVQSCGRR